MCFRTFVYVSVNDSRDILYLNGPDFADPEILLTLYVNWYDTEHIRDEPDRNPITNNDYKFVSYYCPIDFYDDYKEFIKEIDYLGVENVCSENK